jgi:carbon-monoxide dehydrogenase small subunit
VVQVELQVNGESVSREVEDRTLLVSFLRQTLGMTGTHVGCDTTQCGACTVNLNGVAVKSCTVLAAQASGGVVRTVEGLKQEQQGQLHPVQEAFVQCHGLQCGFCTPGMIMAIDYFLSKRPESLDDETIHTALEGNICRCTGYVNIIEAVRHAAHAMYPDLPADVHGHSHEHGAKP